MRPELCEDALRLGRILAELLPEEPEVHGLVALMELTASRAAARTGAAGKPVLLAHQDRGKWDRAQIERGLRALDLSLALEKPIGPLTLQAAIAACHARAVSVAETDWARIASLYGALSEVAPSPVVTLNRAMALGMAEGPAAGLALLETLAAEPSLRQYHRLHAARANLLEKLGRPAEARAEFERAAELTRNAREKGNPARSGPRLRVTRIEVGRAALGGVPRCRSGSLSARDGAPRRGPPALPFTGTAWTPRRAGPPSPEKSA